MGLDIQLRWRKQTEDEQLDDENNLWSAYNQFGFDHWARRHLAVHGLGYIFALDDPKGYSNRYVPDWQACRERAQAMLDQARTLDNLTLFRVSRPNKDPKDYPYVDDVLPIYRAELDRNPEPRSGYWGSWRGTFFPNTPEVVKAVVWGRTIDGDLEPVLVCETQENPHEGAIAGLEHVLRFITLGEQKKGWLRWGY